MWLKDSNVVPPLFFSHFWGLLFFYLAFLSLFYFLTWDNALIMKIITLLFTYSSRITTRYTEQNMTLYECLRRCTGMCNESRVTCMKNYGRWLCHKYDVNYMIMQSTMTMMERVIINGTVEIAWQYISKWLWKCHNR